MCGTRVVGTACKHVHGNGARAHLHAEPLVSKTHGAEQRERMERRDLVVFRMRFVQEPQGFRIGDVPRQLVSRTIKCIKRLEVAAEGGGFVEYADGGPQTAYAVEYTSGMTGWTPVMVGVYSQDVSHVPITISELPRPAVTASEVVDKDTLITFVEEAAKAYRGAVRSDDYSGLVGTPALWARRTRCARKAGTGTTGPSASGT